LPGITGDANRPLEPLKEKCWGGSMDIEMKSFVFFAIRGGEISSNEKTHASSTVSKDIFPKWNIFLFM
jgi:hypothetical protein